MALQTLQTIGAILGIAAFAWKFWDLFQTYIRISVVVDVDEGGVVSAKATIENRTLISKGVDNALLLICPESQDPVDAYNALLVEMGINDCVKSFRGVAVNKRETPIYSASGIAIVPLPFFYNEQESLSEESRAYRASIEHERLPGGCRYSVYLLVWGAGRDHRMTQDSFYNRARDVAG